MNNLNKFQFISLRFTSVALHPKPIGVIFFIGGAFFGSFPTVFYRYLLKYLFDQGFTIIALPYRFTFRHWSVAVSLVKEQVELLSLIEAEAKSRNYEFQIYQENPTSENSKYFWLGHSLGCKYIALLELLTDFEGNNYTQQEEISNSFGNCIPVQEQKNLQVELSNVDLTKVSLKNQNSILMAPVIEGIEGAIPFLRNSWFTGIKKFLDRIGFVKPSQEETFCLIKQSPLFNLTSLIYFEDDIRIGKPSVQWLRENLDQRLVQTIQLKGKHLTPLGFINGNLNSARTVQQFLNI